MSSSGHHMDHSYRMVYAIRDEIQYKGPEGGAEAL